MYLEGKYALTTILIIISLFWPCFESSLTKILTVVGFWIIICLITSRIVKIRKMFQIYNLEKEVKKECLNISECNQE